MPMKKIAAVIICLVVVLVCFKLTFFQATTIFGYDGLVITDDKLTENLSNKPETTNNTLIQPKPVLASDMIYSQNGSLFYGDTRKTKMLQSYPTFINATKALLLLDDSASLIDESFKVHPTFSNLILSGGKAFQGGSNLRLDEVNYPFLRLKNGFFINSLELKVFTKLRTYTFNMNSIHNFLESSIQSYSPVDNNFVYSTIDDVDFESTIQTAGISMTYKEFLKKMSILTEDAPTKENSVDSVDKDKKEPEKADAKPQQDAPNKEDSQKNPQQNDQQDPGVGKPGGLNPDLNYVKPIVKVEALLPIPYGFTSTLEVKDPEGNLRSAVIFYIYDGNELVLRRSFTKSSPLDFSGLKPNHEYKVIAEYDYQDANKKKVTDKFMDVVVRTGGINESLKMDIAGTVEQVTSDSFMVNQMKITSPLNKEIVRFAQVIRIQAGEFSYDLKPDELTSLKKGETINVAFPKLLLSNTDYTVSINAFDRFKNELGVNFTPVKIHTSKKLPEVVFNIVKKDIDALQVRYNIKNPDSVDVKNGKFQLLKANGDGTAGEFLMEIEESKVNDNFLSYQNYAFSDAYILRYIGDVDLNDGKGIQNNFVVKDYLFNNASLSQLGSINLTTILPQYGVEDSFPKLQSAISNDVAAYAYSIKKDTQYAVKYNVNVSASSAKLLELFDELTIQVYTKNESGYKVVAIEKTYREGDDVFTKVKERKEFSELYDNLLPETQYFVDFKASYKKKPIGVAITINQFKTWKETPKAMLKNLTITNKELFADISVKDPGIVSGDKKAMIILQSFNRDGKTDQDKLTKGRAIDVANIDTNKAESSLYLKGLVPNEKYVLNYYISEAKWSGDSFPLKEEKLYLQSYVFTAKDTLEANISIPRIVEDTTDNSKLNVSVKTIFKDMEGIGNGTYYVDVFEGNKKIDSLSYTDAYTIGTAVNKTKVLSIKKANKDYTVKLSTELRTYGTRVELAQAKFNTRASVKEITNCRELYDINGTYDRYKVMNKIDCSAASDRQTVNKFGGELDFDGHEFKFSYSNAVPTFLKKLEKGGIIKNLNFNLRANETSFERGIVQYNYGTISNLYLNTVASNKSKYSAWVRAQISAENEGVIDTFVVDVKNDNILSGEQDVSMVSVKNGGIIRNGYLSPFLFDVSPGGYTGNRRKNGAIAVENKLGGLIENIYSLATLSGNGVFPNTKDTAILVGYNNGTLRNMYTTQAPKNYTPETGPAVGSNYGKVSDIYYIDTKLRNNTSNERIGLNQLHSVSFQNRVLNSENKFDVDRFVYNGYYPQIEFENSNMPQQALRAIESMPKSDKVEYIDYKVKTPPTNPTAFDYHAIVSLTIRNPYQYKITDVSFNNLDAKVLGQTDDLKNSESTVEVRVNVPKDGEFVNDHILRSITYEDASGNSKVVDYPENSSRYTIQLVFYKQVRSIDEWMRINDNPTWNYFIVNDLDFSNTLNLGVLDSEIRGSIEGNNRAISNITTNKRGVFNGGIGSIGSLKNLNFKNVNISVAAIRAGIISQTQVGSLVDNVHGTNINVKDSWDQVGLLVGVARGSINNSSIKDSTITTNLKYIGGLIGILESNGVLSNSFVQNVTLNIMSRTNDEPHSIGGLIGVAKDGNIQNVYAVTTINAKTAKYVGGLIGSMQDGSTNMNSVYAKADITANNTVGGLIGRSSQRGQEVGAETFASKNINGFFTGNINVANASNSNFTIGEVKYPDEIPKQMYVNESSLMKGMAPAPAIAISDEAFKIPNTYTQQIGLRNDFSFNTDATKAILPKLFVKDSAELIPRQEDNFLDIKTLYVKSIMIEKTSVYAQTGTLTAKIFNAGSNEIIGINFLDDTMTANKGTSTYDPATKITTYVAQVIPKYFLDTYTFKNVMYKEKDGTMKDFPFETSVNTKFFRDIATVNDWPKDIPAKYYENYRLRGDIDFTTVTINDAATFNSYFNKNVNDVVGNNHAISNIDATAVSIETGSVGIFNRIKGTFKDVNLTSIKLKYNYTGNTAGVIAQNAGNIVNLTVDTMELEAAEGSGRELGLVGYNAGRLDNITIKNSKIVVTNGAIDDVGLLAGAVDTSDSRVSNITIQTSIVEQKAGGTRIGGVIGVYASSNEMSILNVDNLSVTAKSNRLVGGIIGMSRSAGALTLKDFKLKNITLSGNAGDRRGGIIGESRKQLDIVNAKAESITINSGNSKDVGGFIGYHGTANIEITNSEAKKITITTTRTTNTSVGGLIGELDGGGTITTFTGSDFTLNGTNTNVKGGIVGQQNKNLRLDGIELSKINIAGKHNLGGFVGRSRSDTVARINLHIVNSYARDVSVTGTGVMVGGFVGSTENPQMDVQIMNSGVEAKSITGKRNGAGGMIGGLWDSNGIYITITKSYVKGVNGAKAVIQGDAEAGGLVGESSGSTTGVGNFLRVYDSYAYANVKSTTGVAGLIAGKSTNATIRGFISMGKAEGTGNTGGLIGALRNVNDNVSITSALVLADTTSAATDRANQLIGNRDTATALTFDKVYIYKGNKINNQDVTNSAANYDSISGVETIMYTQLTDPTTFTNNLQFNENWTVESVTANIAPKLTNIKYQTDLEMTTNKNVNTKTVVRTTAINRAKLTSKVPTYDLNMQAYTVDVNKVNLEFDSIDKEGTIEIMQQGNIITKSKLDKFVYTLTYDFKEPFDVVITSGGKSKKYTIDPNTIRREAYVDDKIYAYTSNDGITLENGFIKGKFVNLYKSKAMDDNGVIYDLNSKQSIGKVANNLALDAYVEALYTFTLEGQKMQTFHGFSAIGTTIRPGNMYVKNEQLVYFDANTPMIKDSILVDKVNGKEIETILTTDGKLKNLKDPLPLPDNFVNEGIEYVTSSLNNNRGIMIVSYKDGAKFIYNYKTAEVLYNKEAPVEKTDFFTFLKKNLSLNFLSIVPSLGDKYEIANKTAEKLMNTQGFNEVLESTTESGKVEPSAIPNKVEMNTNGEKEPSSDKKPITTEKTPSKRVQAKLISVYNPEKKDYELYNTGDLLNPELKEVNDIKEMADKNPELMSMLKAEVQKSKRFDISNYAMIILVITLISGCLWYIIRQRKVVRRKQA